MDRREYCHELADMNERLYEIDKQLDKIKINSCFEKDPERQDWFTNAQDKLLNEKDELETKVDEFMSQYSYLIDD